MIRRLLMIALSLSLSACTFLNENLIEYVVVVQGQQPDEVYLQFPERQMKATRQENSFTVLRAPQEHYATGVSLINGGIEHVCQLHISDEPGFLQFTVAIEDDRCMIIEERAGNGVF